MHTWFSTEGRGRFVWGFLVAVGMLAAGCGGEVSKEKKRGTGTAKGAVTLDGKPLTSGIVALFDEEDGDTAMGEVGTDGTFTLKYKGAANIPRGKYRVAVSPAPPPVATDPNDMMKNPDKYKPVPSEIPEKYRDAKKSGLNTEIKEGENQVELKLTK